MGYNEPSKPFIPIPHIEFTITGASFVSLNDMGKLLHAQTRTSCFKVETICTTHGDTSAGFRFQSR